MYMSQLWASCQSLPSSQNVVQLHERYLSVLYSYRIRNICNYLPTQYLHALVHTHIHMYVQHDMSPSCMKDSTINFLNVESGDNQSLKMCSAVSAVVPVAGRSDKLVALIERAICIVDKETGDDDLHIHIHVCMYCTLKYKISPNDTT